MGDGFIVILFILVAVAAIVIRILAGGMDGDRVKRYVESRGGRLIESNWAPFGKGWFGEKNDRIYDVRYKDRDGNEHAAHVKTSMLSGVYFTEDQIVRRAKREPDVDVDAELDANAADDARLALEMENQQLREEVERLRREQG